jgi:glucose/arabinose dehydrogenase
MTNGDHSTRTLLLSLKMPGMLLVSRGSGDNIDPVAADEGSGRSQIRAFNISAGNEGSLPYQYNTTGTILGWGLRNSVGVAEHPVTGGVYSVENSADDLERMGVDIHTNNPGEEMNYHSSIESYFNGTDDPRHGANFGYPICFAAWNVSAIPEAGSLQTGDEFSINTISAQNNDSICASKSLSPRLTFPAHWAPLDILFNGAGSLAYVTSHGSW